MPLYIGGIKSDRVVDPPVRYAAHVIGQRVVIIGRRGDGYRYGDGQTEGNPKPKRFFATRQLLRRCPSMASQAGHRVSSQKKHKDQDSNSPAQAKIKNAQRRAQR